MRNKNLLILGAILLVPSFCQTQISVSRELKGRVVEIRNGETVGIENVTVSIIGFHYDISNQDGYFKLVLPPDRDRVSIELQNSPSKMVSPYSGIVNLPPDANFQIVVCGQENRRLSDKITKLNADIKKLEKEKKLSSKQMQEMHHALLDTIIHFEKQIEIISHDLHKSGEQNAALSAEIAARDERIRVLEASEEQLIAALRGALKEKFLQQKQYFDSVSADLLSYLDRLKEIRDRCTPSQLPFPFKNPQASEQLSKKLQEYNDVRNAIMKNHSSNELGVVGYWDNPDVGDNLKSTYQFLLKDVHEGEIIPIDQQIFGQVREVATNPLGREKALKKAQKAADELLPDLNNSIVELEKRIQQTIHLMATNI